MLEPGLEDALSLPLPAMAVAESYWWSGAFFLERPTTDASGGCPAVVLAPKGQLLGLKKILKKSVVTIAIILSNRTVGSEGGSFQSAELLQIFKTFCHGKFQPQTK